jgi:hypothetical protein
MRFSSYTRSSGTLGILCTKVTKFTNFNEIFKLPAISRYIGGIVYIVHKHIKIFKLYEVIKYFWVIAYKVYILQSFSSL